MNKEHNMRISERRIKQIINEETRRALREADIKGGSFAVKPGYKLPANLKPGDRLPADMFDEPSMSPEEGPGARAAMRIREPGMRSVGDPDYLASLDFGDGDDGDDGDDDAMRDMTNAYAHASGGRTPTQWGGEGFDDSYDEDEDLDADEYEDEDADEYEDEDSEGEDEEPYDSDNPPTFMNRTSADRRDDPDMGSGGGDEDSEGDVDPDEDSDDPFYSGGHRVKEQRSLNFRSIVKEETLKFLRSRR
jgi:hypothetical protein